MSEMPIVNEMIEEEKPWTITDDSSAEWAMEQIADANAELEKWTAFYAERLGKIEATTQNTIQYFTAKLKEYFETVPHHQTKTQESYELPSGKLVMKAQAPEYVRDDEKLMVWAKESGNDEFIKTKETLDWSKMKKEVSKYTMVDGKPVDPFTGEIIDGLNVIEREPKFTIE